METEIVIPAKRSIYHIENDYLQLMQRIEDAEGELTDEMAEELAINEKELQMKAVNYGYVMRQLDSEVSQIDEEIARLNKMKTVKANMKDRLKTTVSEAMLKYGIDKIELGLLKLCHKPSETLVVGDDAKVPSAYLKTKETVTVDKAGLKKAIKQGAEFDGIWIQTNQNLQIS